MKLKINCKSIVSLLVVVLFVAAIGTECEGKKYKPKKTSPGKGPKGVRYRYKVASKPEDKGPEYIQYCKGSPGGKIEYIEVEPCILQSNGQPPCIFRKGSQVAVRGRYVAGHSADDLKAKMRIKVGFFDKPHHHKEKACEHQWCPVFKGEAYDFDYANLTIPMDMPSSRGTFTLDLVDKKSGQSVVCGVTAVQYKK